MVMTLSDQRLIDKDGNLVETPASQDAEPWHGSADVQVAIGCHLRSCEAG